MKIIFLYILTFIFSENSFAQEDIFNVEKGFLIINSSKDYNQSLKKAQKASDELGYKLDLRGYTPNDSTGLSTNKICGCGYNHGYISRGRFDDGNYISIEYTNGFEGFTKNYYIIVVSSFEKNKTELKESLQFVKNKYNDAYIKYASVYMGCMH